MREKNVKKVILKFCRYQMMFSEFNSNSDCAWPTHHRRVISSQPTSSLLRAP